MHLREPPLSETVRIDAGFVQGDEVSSHYDPMIAKLIVQGTSREVAIQKLHAALGQYQIVGPVTNIGFLKKVCGIPAFVAGDVETGFIPKHKDALFQETEVAPEVYAQAALGTFFLEAAASHGQPFPGDNQIGFSSGTRNRDFRFVLPKGDGSTTAPEILVSIQIDGKGLFDVSVNGRTFQSVASYWDSITRDLTSYFPHARLDTRVVNHDGDLNLFQQGQQYRFKLARPGWVEKALGIKDKAHSVLAPMPCKILKVHVAEGDSVKKDQPLVVIESMKMETVIRSPQNGTVSRIVHRQGVSASACSIFVRLTIAQDLCKAGTALVEFEVSEGIR